MLLAAKTLSKSFSDNIEAFSEIHDNWTPEYAADLARRIDEAIDSYMVFDKREDLKNATAYLTSIAVPALKDLTLFRILIRTNFKEESAELLSKLGFNGHYLNARKKGSQEALIANLAGFRKGMTEKIKNKLISKGIKPGLIERIISYSQNLRDANMVQEVMKENVKLVTDETKIVFNGIYDEIMSICKVGRIYDELNPIVRQQFNFRNILRNMSASARSSSTAVQVETDPEVESLPSSAL
jgi:hypothetical protein